MVRVLDLLQDYLASVNYSYERLDGSVARADRERALRNFKEGNTFVFLLCTRAGGTPSTPSMLPGDR